MKSLTSRSAEKLSQRTATLLRGLVAVVLVALLGVRGAASALAEDQPSLGSIEQVLTSDDYKKDRNGGPNGNTLVVLKTAAASDVAKRQRTLDRLTADLQSASVDCGPNAGLVTHIADTSVVLNEIAGRIGAATDLKAAKAAAAELFPATRVFTVVSPQVEVALVCGDVVTQSQRLQARIATAQLSVEPVKSNPEAQGAINQITVASAAVKAIPSLAQASESVADLVADKGDVTIANNNAAAFETVRRQVKEAAQALDVASKSVKELERLVDVALKKPSKTTKPKRPVK